jgi:hypothetical protein
MFGSHGGAGARSAAPLVAVAQQICQPILLAQHVREAAALELSFFPSLPWAARIASVELHSKSCFYLNVRCDLDASYGTSVLGKMSVVRFALKILVGVLTVLFIVSAIWQTVVAWHARKLERMEYQESAQYRRMMDTSP